jgi:chromosome segregation ATPase
MKLANDKIINKQKTYTIMFSPANIMNAAPAIMILHLRYRLWIAEMNYDINVLRIFEDYIKELSGKNEHHEVQAGIADFKQKFGDIRKEIDELRHEMHLHKMELASISREGKQLDDETYKRGHHDNLKKQYINFRKKMEKLKIEFTGFENRWLN